MARVIGGIVILSALGFAFGVLVGHYLPFPIAVVVAPTVSFIGAGWAAKHYLT